MFGQFYHFNTQLEMALLKLTLVLLLSIVKLMTDWPETSKRRKFNNLKSKYILKNMQVVLNFF